MIYDSFEGFMGFLLFPCSPYTVINLNFTLFNNFYDITLKDYHTHKRKVAAPAPFIVYITKFFPIY